MLIAYSLEILPYRVRAKGFAVMVSTCAWYFSLADTLGEFGDYGHDRLQHVCEPLGDGPSPLVLPLGLCRLALHRADLCIRFCG